MVPARAPAYGSVLQLRSRDNNITALGGNGEMRSIDVRVEPGRKGFLSWSLTASSVIGVRPDRFRFLETKRPQECRTP